MQVAVCPVTELESGSSLVVAAEGRQVAVFNVDGDLYAIDNLCAHRQQPLVDGVIRDGVITCPAHLWRYDIRSGERDDAPGWAVSCYPVTVQGSTVMVEIPEPKPPQSIREQLLQHAREWRRDE